jgi:hypothetical protein
MATLAVQYKLKQLRTDKKENQIFLIVYKEIQSGAVAKSSIRKGFLRYMRKCANISPYMRGR